MAADLGLFLLTRSLQKRRKIEGKSAANLNDLQLHLVVRVRTLEREAYGLNDAVDKQLLRVGTVSRISD